jgi:hypothetical protein
MTEGAPLPPMNEQCGVCDECQKLQDAISHYRQFLKQRFDPLTEKRIKIVIADLERRKSALHATGAIC